MLRYIVMRRTLALLLTAALIAIAGMVAGCGDNEPARTWSEQEIVDALNLVPDPNFDPQFAIGLPGEGLWTAGTHCVVAVVLATPQEVALYRDAGDAVATIPSGTAGVKVGTYQGSSLEVCQRTFEERLRKLR